ncbi:MAG: thioredoxin [Planctomycetota bacterium]
MYALPSCRGGQADGGHLRALTSEEFDDAVASGVVLVDFWAPWCGPCRQQTPILEQVARRVDGRAVVMKVNVDDQGDLAERFDVRSIPTLILLRDGRPVERFVGVQNAETLIDAIDSAAETDAP